MLLAHKSPIAADRLRSRRVVRSSQLGLVAIVPSSASSLRGGGLLELANRAKLSVFRIFVRFFRRQADFSRKFWPPGNVLCQPADQLRLVLIFRPAKCWDNGTGSNRGRTISRRWAILADSLRNGCRLLAIPGALSLRVRRTCKPSRDTNSSGVRTTCGA